MYTDCEGNQVNADYRTSGMTEAIRGLANLGEEVKNLEEDSRDYGMELYELHEIHGGREDEFAYSGCGHTEIIYVADGDFRQISNGKTKVWAFCTDCGEQIGEEHLACYWIWYTHQEHTRMRSIDPRFAGNFWIKTTETKHKIPAEYGVPSKIYRPEQALPLIKRACDNRKARLEWGPEDFMEDSWSFKNDP